MSTSTPPDRWHGGQAPLPSGIVVERLALAMSAAAGILWAQAEPETRQFYRVLASAALAHLGLEGGELGLAHLTGELEAGARTLRAVGVFLEPVDGAEASIQAVIRLGAFLEILGAAVSPPEEPWPD